MRRFILTLVVFMPLSLLAQQQKKLLAPDLVDLKGKTGVAVFVNQTTDTLHLSGMFYNWLPYYETRVNLNMAPGKADSVALTFNYPDFLTIDKMGRVFNAPGKRVICKITQFTDSKIACSFAGDFADENTYYIAYNKFIGNPDQEGRPYYLAGDKVKSFNDFPAIADSITAARTRFLNDYNGALPSWFKAHEQQRLAYNGMMRKYNVLASKEFYGGKPILVRPEYYSFEKDLKLTSDRMALNTEYLWATDFYFVRHAKQVTRKVPDTFLYVVDSLAGNTPEGDVFRMRRLGAIYTSSAARYDSVFPTVKFRNPQTALVTDSLIHARLGLPKTGLKAPDFTLSDINGKPVALKDFSGKAVIINFWAVWCGPCIAEFANENRLFQRYKDKGLVVINICVDSSEAQWRTVSQVKGLQTINLFAKETAYKRLKSLYNIGSLPRSVAIGKDQKVINNYYPRAGQLADKDVSALTSISDYKRRP